MNNSIFQYYLINYWYHPTSSKNKNPPDTYNYPGDLLTLGALTPSAMKGRSPFIHEYIVSFLKMGKQN